MTYADALAAYLSQDGAKQAELAEKVGCKQATISRYKSGERLPDRALAENIDKATDGQVPLSLWIVAASKKFGLAA
jgi:transcriptional regulator with XRE-family HTH domain